MLLQTCLFFFPVPIVPKFLYDINHPNEQFPGVTTTTVPPKICTCPNKTENPIETTMFTATTDSGKISFEAFQVFLK